MSVNNDFSVLGGLLFFSSTALLALKTKAKQHKKLIKPSLYTPLTANQVYLSDNDDVSTGKYYTSNPADCVDVRTERWGANSLVPVTIPQFFRENVVKHKTKIALAVKRDPTSAQWKTWTFQQYWDDCVSFAKSLIRLEVPQHGAINILGFNAPEWFIANMGSMLVGSLPAGIYSTNNTEACHYITHHSKAQVLVVDGLAQLQKYLTATHLVDLKCVVVWGDEVIDPALIAKSAIPVYSWSEFLHLGVGVALSAVEARIAAVKPGHCASLIYTSGTTGPPKAVMLSNDNITWTCQIFATEYVVDGMLPGRVVSYLPLSHVAAQMIDIHYGYYSGTTVFFAQPDALKGSLSATLKEVRPTVFFAVPRVWEKMEEKLKEMGQKTTGVKKVLSTWAKQQGFAHCQQAQFGAIDENGSSWSYELARVLVLDKIKEALGLDKCRAYFTAAAPISIETLKYFASLDIALYELFGQSESTGPHTSSKFGQWKFGYCGRPLPGTRSKIDPDSQELRYRGRHIFMGYAFMPDETLTSFDSLGYLRSGDVAEFDGNDLSDVLSPSGFMRITGRIKDLIITAGGENIPPTIIESEMKLQLPVISNCLVVGDRRKYLVMLVSLKCEVDPETGEPTNVLSEDVRSIGALIGSTATTVQQAAKDAAWTAYIDQGVKRANQRTTSRAQVVQRWALLPTDLSEKQGLLTPTLKVKRNVVCDLYADLIVNLYNSLNGSQDS